MRLLGAHKAYGATAVLHVDELSFARDKVYAVIGSNGSGKTTLLRVLAGQVPLDEGTVEIGAGECIGYMPQKSYAFFGSVEKNVRLGAYAKGSGQAERQQAVERAEGAPATTAADRPVPTVAEAPAMATAKALATTASDASAATTAKTQVTAAEDTLAHVWSLPSTERAQALMKELGIDALAKSNAKRLSGGETARMALVRLLMGTYSYLLLDEPTAALDVTSTLVAERLVCSYCATHNAGLVVVTHSVKQAERIADEVLFMHEGLVLERGNTAEVLAHPQTEELKRFLEVAGA